MGLADGEDAARGEPTVTPPQGTQGEPRTYSYPGARVYLMLCRMKDPEPQPEPLASIRKTMGLPGALGFVTASFRFDEPKQADGWWTIVGRLVPSAIRIAGELKVDPAALAAEKDEKKRRRLEVFDAAYVELGKHEHRHMVEAFEYLDDNSLGLETGFRNMSSRPSLQEVRRRLSGAETEALKQLAESARKLDDADLGPMQGRWASVGLQIDSGENPKVHYNPPQ
jgi:hypothetical protein